MICRNNNKRIAKNTLMLYIRMLLITTVSLYTSRVILNTLGVVDFGIYNVVGGIVFLFSVLNGALSSSTQRLLSFERGKNNIESQRKIFSVSLTIYLMLSLTIIIFAESFGLWFLYNFLNISEGRLEAAIWAYHFVILTFCFNIIRVPYNSLIISNEKMMVFAVISTVEVILKLILVYFLLILKTDKLILFSFFMSLVSIIIFILYKIYCNKYLYISQFSLIRDKAIYKEIINFSGWNLLGSSSNIFASQGINILLNITFGVVVNASVGIANQVRSAISQFVSNFQMAFNPHMVKLYAMDEKENFIKLIFQTSKFSYFLLFVISLPIMLNIKFILHFWLGSVPEYVPQFCILSIITLLIDAMAAPLGMSILATGDIKKYQIIYSVFSILPLPIAYLTLQYGFSPPYVFVVILTVNFLTFIWKIFFLKKQINMSSMKYIKDVVLLVFLISIFSAFMNIEIKNYTNNGWNGFLVTSFFSILSSSILIYFTGLKAEEKLFIYNICFNIFDKLKKYES